MLKVEAYPPPATREYVKSNVHAVANTNTPVCVFCQYATICKEPYKRYLENKIRDNWDFSGVPIDIYIREIVIEKSRCKSGFFVVII
jgi:GTP-binding protein